MKLPLFNESSPDSHTVAVLHKQELMRISHDLEQVYQHVPDGGGPMVVPIGRALPLFQTSVQERAVDSVVLQGATGVAPSLSSSMERLRALDPKML